MNRITRRGVSGALLTLVLAMTYLVAPSTAATGQTADHNANPMVFPADARPYGRSMATWGEKSSQWIYGTPMADSPLFDPTGANCDVGQRGKVWYVARIAGPPVFSGTRYCTIPHDKAILLYIGAVVSSYPCAADPEFGPEPGQSLYDFLAADADFFMDTVDHLEIEIDGRPVERPFDYRYRSDDLFSNTGDLSLQEEFDGCITGSPQEAVVDGFFMMVKPLKRGQHVVRVHGTNTFGHNKTFVYYLTIR